MESQHERMHIRHTYHLNTYIYVRMYVRKFTQHKTAAIKQPQNRKIEKAKTNSTAHQKSWVNRRQPPGQ